MVQKCNNFDYQWSFLQAFFKEYYIQGPYNFHNIFNCSNVEHGNALLIFLRENE